MFRKRIIEQSIRQLCCSRNDLDSGAGSLPVASGCFGSSRTLNACAARSRGQAARSPGPLHENSWSRSRCRRRREVRQILGPQICVAPELVP